MRRRCHSAPAPIGFAQYAANRKSRLQQIKIGIIHRTSCQQHGFKNYILSPDFVCNLLPIPDVDTPCSKRCWDSQVRTWRRLLHAYDQLGVLQQCNAAGFPLIQQQAHDTLLALIMYQYDLAECRARSIEEDQARPRSWSWSGERSSDSAGCGRVCSVMNVTRGGGGISIS